MITHKIFDETKEVAAVIADIETTGLSKESDDIVNVSLLGIADDFSLVSVYDVWGTPFRKMIPQHVVSKTGLSNLDVALFSNNETMLSHAKDLLETMKGFDDCIWIAQNIKFDIGFLALLPKVYKLHHDFVLRFGKRLDIIDVYKDNRPGSKSLDTQMSTLGITDSSVKLKMKLKTGKSYERHTGMFDVFAEYAVLTTLASEIGVDSVEKLYGMYKRDQ